MREVRLMVVILVVAAAGAAALAPPAAAASFTVYGDIDDWSAGGDPTPVFSFVCAGMKAAGAVRAVSTGDALVDQADTSTEVALARWRAVLDVEGEHLGVPVWRTAGDNDRLDVPARLAAWNEVFAAYPTRPDPQRRWYSRDSKGIHFVFLNTAHEGYVGWLGYDGERAATNSTQARWLVRDLRAAAARQPSTIVVVSHYPIVKGKTTRPYAVEKAGEARRLRRLFARYGVDLVLTGDTHVYRRTMVTVTKGSRTFKVPYVQIPPAASNPRAFGVSPIPGLATGEAGWAPGDGARGFVRVAFDRPTRRLTLAVRKVAVADGAVSSAAGERATARMLGGTFRDTPSGCRL